MKIAPTACKKFDAFLMHYPSENICINKNYKVPQYQQEYALFSTISHGGCIQI